MSNSSSKNHNKKSSANRDRNKSVASESGGSSQCDTPPLNEKVIDSFYNISTVQLLGLEVTVFRK